MVPRAWRNPSRTCETFCCQIWQQNVSEVLKGFVNLYTITIIATASIRSSSARSDSTSLLRMQWFLEVDKSAEDLRHILLPVAKLVVQLLPLRFAERSLYRLRDYDPTRRMIHLGVDRFRLHDYKPPYRLLAGCPQVALSIGQVGWQPPIFLSLLASPILYSTTATKTSKLESSVTTNKPQGSCARSHKNQSFWTFSFNNSRPFFQSIIL